MPKVYLRLACLVRSHRIASIAQTAENVYTGYGIKVAEHTLQCRLLSWTGPQSNGRTWPCLKNAYSLLYVTRLNYGKKAIQWRQYEVLGKVVLGIVGPWYSCRCHLNMYHLHRHFCGPSTQPQGKGMFQEQFEDEGTVTRRRWTFIITGSLVLML